MSLASSVVVNAPPRGSVADSRGSRATWTSSARLAIVSTTPSRRDWPGLSTTLRISTASKPSNIARAT